MTSADGVQVIKNRAGVLQRHVACRLLFCIVLKRRTCVLSRLRLHGTPLSRRAHAPQRCVHFCSHVHALQNKATPHTSTCFVENWVPPLSTLSALSLR